MALIHNSPSPVQHGAIGRKLPAPSFSLGRQRVGICIKCWGGTAHWIVFCLAYVRAHSRCLGDNENTSELRSLRLLQRTHGVAGRAQQR